MSETVSLKEYFEEKISNLKERFLASEAENSKALTLQASETERRLDALNGEAGRITKVLEASIPREVHERDMKELNDKIGVLTLAGTTYVTKDQLAATLKTPNDDIRILTSSKDIQTGRSLQTAVFISLFVSAIGIILGTINLLK